MDTGSHIPAYLLCERFCKDGRVLDLNPPDERGCRTLATSAKQVMVVQGSISDFPSTNPASLSRIVAKVTDLPLKPSSVDLAMILFVDSGSDGEKLDLEASIRAARGLLTPSGVIAVQIPNKDVRHLLGGSGKGSPDFLDFERALRRHFPHVMMFSQQALYGATLLPIGRRQRDEGPILDDRLIPEGGEPPSHFLALCSPRYQRFDDTLIAQLPFTPLASDIRAHAEKLEGTVHLLQKDKELRAEKNAILTEKLDALRSQLDAAETANRELSPLKVRIAQLTEKLDRQESLIASAEQARDEQAGKVYALEDELHDLNRKVRRLEQQIADAQKMTSLTSKDREEMESERQKALVALHESQNLVKNGQRQIDDLVEQLAGTHGELDILRKEAAGQRRDLVSERERVRALTIQLQELEERGGGSQSLMAEIDRIKANATEERDRLEGRIADEHDKQLAIIAEKEDLRRKLQQTELMLKEREFALEAIEAQKDRKDQNLEFYTSRISSLDQERADLHDELRRSEETLEKIGMMAQERADEIARQEHTLELLKLRANDAEVRLKAQSEKTNEFHKALTEAEASVNELLVHKAKAESLEVRYSRSMEQIKGLEEQLEKLRPEASAAKSARNRAQAAEAALTEEKKRREDLEHDHAETAATLSRLQRDLSNAMDALAETEEGAENRIQSAADRIREIMDEARRLKEENETELMLVREDLETELRNVSSQLEAREGEIWELREENVRLKAQAAASVAAAQHAGKDVDLSKRMMDQEELIDELTSERNHLRSINERQDGALKVRKKNLKILAALLKRERLAHEEREGELRVAMERRPLGLKAPEERHSLITRDLDIKSLLAKAGGEMSDDLDDIFDSEIPLPPMGRGGDLKESVESDLDDILDSVLRSPPRKKSRGPFDR